MEKNFEEFSSRLSLQSSQLRWKNVKEALKGYRAGHIERIFKGDCEVINPRQNDDTLPVGVRFDEGKMVNFFLEKVYPSGAPDGLFEEVLGRLIHPEETLDAMQFFEEVLVEKVIGTLDYETDGYFFCRNAKNRDHLGGCTAARNIVYDDDTDADFYIPSVSDKDFCENFFLTYLEIQLFYADV